MGIRSAVHRLRPILTPKKTGNLAVVLALDRRRRFRCRLSTAAIGAECCGLPPSIASRTPIRRSETIRASSGAALAPTAGAAGSALLLEQQRVHVEPLPVSNGQALDLLYGPPRVQPVNRCPLQCPVNTGRIPPPQPPAMTGRFYPVGRARPPPENAQSAGFRPELQLNPGTLARSWCSLLVASPAGFVRLGFGELLDAPISSSGEG